jgi:acyl carrier protein
MEFSAESGATNGGASEANGQASAERIELSVVDWLRRELDSPEITSSDNFIDIGGHSLTFSKLNAFLNDFYGVMIDQKITYGESISTAVAKTRPVERT